MSADGGIPQPGEGAADGTHAADGAQARGEARTDVRTEARSEAPAAIRVGARTEARAAAASGPRSRAENGARAEREPDDANADAGAEAAVAAETGVPASAPASDPAPASASDPDQGPDPAEAAGGAHDEAVAGGSAEAARGDSGHAEAEGEPQSDTARGGDSEGTAPDGGGDEGEPTVRDAISAPDAQGRPRRTTRRFPLFTRDTARPEGGGRAAPSDAPAPARQWPILTVLSAVGLGLLLTALDKTRVGTILIGVALIAGAVMRWILPSVGMLAVRSRFTDMVTYGVLGVAIVLLAMMAQPSPWLEIPFLDDTLHFTVR